MFFCLNSLPRMYNLHTKVFKESVVAQKILKVKGTWKRPLNWRPLLLSE